MKVGIRHVGDSKLTDGGRVAFNQAGKAVVDANNFEVGISGLKKVQVWVHNERWGARTESPIKKGQAIKVTKIDGLTLHVKPSDTR